jgi:3-mercaptopyruvate sulfurtransferase SseA
MTLNQATTAAAGTLDLDWIIQGSNNTITSSINIDQATNYMDIDGSDNTITYAGTGVNASAGGYFWLDHTGGSRTFSVSQTSTQNNDWLKITSNGSNGSVCVEQDDQGTAVGC